MGGRRENARLGGGGVAGDAPSTTHLTPTAAPVPLAASPAAAASAAAAPVAATCVVTTITGAAAAVYDEK